MERSLFKLFIGMSNINSKIALVLLVYHGSNHPNKSPQRWSLKSTIEKQIKKKPHSALETFCVFVQARGKK